MTVLAGGQVLTAAGWDKTDVTVRGGRIASIATVGAHPEDANVVDVHGWRLAPGLIDLQINGGFGHDFTQNPETIWDVGARLPEFGVCAFLPTIITAPSPTIANAQRVMAAGPPSGYTGATPIGLHLEGPLLSADHPGTHDTRYLAEPTAVATDTWSPDTGVRMVTLAPELPGALDVIEALRDRGVVVAVGHSNATYDQAAAGIKCGATVGTHLYNAMSPLHHRQPGLVGALLSEPNVTVGIIADGIHTHPAAVRIAWEAKGPDRFVLVTDAMAAMGMGHGRFVISSVDVIVDETGPRNRDGALAGSALTLDEAVRNLVDYARCTPEQAITAATANPARVLDDPTRGALEVGARADICLLDDDLQVQATMLDGDFVYESPRPSPTALATDRDG